MTPELFYESYLEALKDDVRASGGAKVVGPTLWPSKSVEGARNKLNDSLNPERRERLSEEEERLIMRRAREARGFSAALHYLCDDCGFERTKPRVIEDEMSELQRQFVAATRIQQAIVERLERLNEAAPGNVRAVR